MTAKITTGLNDRPRDASIAGTAPGLPDDSSKPPEASDEEIARVAAKLKNDPRKKLERELEDEIELPLKGSA